MREHNTFRWYFAVASLFLMTIMTIVLRAHAASFKDGSLHIKSTVEGAAPVVSLNVDIASTDASREKGLSKRKSLAKDEGMLFLFNSPAPQTFWMKDMRFPIDVIWIREGRVVELTPDLPVPTPGLPLERYPSLQPVDAVLEVNRGFIKKYGISPGMEVDFTVDK